MQNQTTTSHKSQVLYFGQDKSMLHNISSTRKGSGELNEGVGIPCNNKRITSSAFFFSQSKQSKLLPKYNYLLISPNSIKYQDVTIYLRLGKIYLTCKKIESFTFKTVRNQL